MTEIQKDYIRIQKDKWQDKAETCPALLLVTENHMALCKAISDVCSPETCMFQHWDVV
jgi:hypothetical protein